MQQVEKDHYVFDNYCYFDRWSSYYYQLKFLLKYQPESILEIGVGDGVVKYYIKNNTKISYSNVDIASDLNPDIVGSIESLPLKDGSYDIVCAFEVLEHLPFDKFENCLLEMKRVARSSVMISLPHFGPPVQFYLKLPFLPPIKFAGKFKLPLKHVFNGQHYWELGKKGYSVSRVKKILSKHFEIVEEYIPFENQYHHFFILKK